MAQGITSVFYVNIAGYDAPDWTEIDLISDLTVNSNWNEGESSVRRGRTQTFEPTNLALDLAGKIRKDMNDAGLTAIRAHHLAATTVDILVLDGPIATNGSEGYRFDGKVFSFGEDQGLGAVTFKDFTIKPCASTHLPQSVLVAGGVPVYSEFG